MIQFDDLNLSDDLNIAYQINPQPYSYSKEYWDNYNSLENTEISRKLNAFRCKFVEKYADSVLDVGIGSGAFLKNTCAKGYGFDINPFAVDYLKEKNQFFDPYETENYPFKAWTFWDCIEHMANPKLLLSKVKQDQFVFVSLPIFSDLTKVKQSKHYKPNEHVIYFTARGLLNYFVDLNLKCLEISDAESVIGRENILSFAFQKGI